MSLLRRITKVLATDAPQSTVLVRLIVGGIFLSEGVQKFLFPSALGVGRFTRIGIPWPEFMAPFVGTFEICCGLLIILGFVTRLAAIPMIINMLVAITSTKIPMFAKSGFWTTAHESRADWSMILGSVFLLVVGAGRLSLDAKLAGTKKVADG